MNYKQMVGSKNKSEVQESSKIHSLTDKELEEERILEQKNAQKRKEATPNLSEDEREFCERFFCVFYAEGMLTSLMGGVYDNYLFYIAEKTIGMTKNISTGSDSFNNEYSYFFKPFTEYVNKLQTTQDMGWIEDFLSYNPCYKYYVICDKINEKINKIQIKDKYLFLRDSKIDVQLKLNKKHILSYVQITALWNGADCVEIKDSTTSYIQQTSFDGFLNIIFRLTNSSKEYLFEPHQNEELSIQKIMLHPQNYFFTFNKTEKIKECFQEEVKIRQELLKRYNNRTNLCLKM